MNLLHLTKEKCLRALPPMKREPREVPLDQRPMAKYQHSVKDLALLYDAMRTNKNLDNNVALGATQKSTRPLCFCQDRSYRRIGQDDSGGRARSRDLSEFRKGCLCCARAIGGVRMGGCPFDR